MGVLCAPDDRATAPGVLLLGGSEGGLHTRDAELLAAQGFTVLALAYFASPGLPPGLIEIPVEYFQRGLDVLAKQPAAGERFGVTGGSRGGEASLLLGAHDPRIAAVVSVAGSGLLTHGIDFRRGSLGSILSTPTASWTVAGAALPYLPHVFPEELVSQINARRPVALRLAFPEVPEDAAELDRLSIPVERIDGAVLLLAGEDDQSWPSGAYSQVAIDRLSAHAHRYPYELEILPGVGHPIAGPPGKPFSSTTAPGPGVTFEMGGSPAANTAGRRHAWKRTVSWLREHLSAPPAP